MSKNNDTSIGTVSNIYLTVRCQLGIPRDGVSIPVAVEEKYGFKTVSKAKWLSQIDE